MTRGRLPECLRVGSELVAESEFVLGSGFLGDGSAPGQWLQTRLRAAIAIWCVEPRDAAQ